MEHPLQQYYTELVSLLHKIRAELPGEPADHPLVYMLVGTIQNVTPDENGKMPDLPPNVNGYSLIEGCQNLHTMNVFGHMLMDIQMSVQDGNLRVLGLDFFDDPEQNIAEVVIPRGTRFN